MTLENSAAPSPCCAPSDEPSSTTSMRVGAEHSGPTPSGSSRLPKKQLLSCTIEAHTIQKCPSPKKKALDPLRYIPERASYFALFTLVAHFEDHTAEYHTTRSYRQFSTLHSQLQKKFPKSKLPKDVPTMRKKRFDNLYIEQKCKELNDYLKQLLELSEVKHSRILRDFLEECPQSEESDENDPVPTKMLDGLPGTIVRVRAGQSFSVSLRLQNSGDTASWQFTTKKHNIGFSATFNGVNIHVYSREESQVKPVKGSFKCTEPGTLALDWDNTYTWSKTKVLIYWAEVEQARGLSSPDLLYDSNATGISASPSGTASGGGLLSPSLSDATPMIDGRRSGYIAHSRNRSLYPRQIVNTSLSLITKPFIWSKNDQPPQIKSGPLIVERNLKFRGRNWYRKWFVLDTAKCMLRYYDSEQASRKGLSLAKMNLATKNACLAITSNESEAAPTPYLFMVRARKRCWKMCASSQSEYNEWEHAISTAILTAQLKRRNDRSNSAEVLDCVRGDGDTKEDVGDRDESDEDEDEDDDDGEVEEGGVKEDDGDDEEEDGDSDEDDPDSDRARGDSASADTLPAGTVEASVAPLPTADQVASAEFALEKKSGEIEKTVESYQRLEELPLSLSLSLSQPPPPLLQLLHERHPTVCFCEHWLGQLRSLSPAKKLLIIVWVNGFILSLRSSTLAILASTFLVANGYLLIHALEPPRRRMHP